MLASLEKAAASNLKHVWLLGLICVLIVAYIQPQALGPMVRTAAKVWLGIVMGYWADRSLFHYARPSESNPNHLWMYRRVAVVGVCVLGFSLGT